MPSRDVAPIGAPCWADLWTSDVEGSRRFYSELFGWEALEPAPDFGGYFMFARAGVPVAGAMGDMGDVPADNAWKIYLATDDMGQTLQSAEAAGAQVVMPAVTVADLGVQAVLIDPTGVPVGVWEPHAFAGFSVLGEPGAPSWFELMTPNYAAALEFYRSTFHLDPKVMGDSDEFRYSAFVPSGGGEEVAGIMDASAFLPEGSPGQWSVYWDVEDAAAAVAKVRTLGGSVVADVQQTPYGQIATVADPSGATFRLRTGAQ
jgi:predicted enzyme related to lactoylglutathione lyase